MELISARPEKPSPICLQRPTVSRARDFKGKVGVELDTEARLLDSGEEQRER